MKKNAPLVFAGWPALSATVFLAGCSGIPLLDPKGPIGAAELYSISVATALMLIVVIPVIAMALWFPFKYRASAPRGDYAPKWSHSGKIDLIVWLVPAVIVALLGVVNWKETHRLDPFEPINPVARQINIEVVSLDWKWLFIYPELNIASVNQLVFPANVPVSFRVTSDSVMASFFIPQLGSQIYAMSGMQSRLHLLADEPGVYFGQNQQFSGRGYSDMNFKVRVTSREQFEAWIQEARQSPDKLDLARFKELSNPSISFPVTSFSRVEYGLFDGIMNKYRTAMGKEMASSRVKTGASGGI